MGYEFLHKEGHILQPLGENLAKVIKIKGHSVHKSLSGVSIKIACDITNPFYGKDGAANIYGPQKRASKEEALLLDSGLRNIASIMRNEFGIDAQDIPGAGAAGRVGGGAIVFLSATLTSGIDLIKEMAAFDEAIAHANWTITGEGKLDPQTLSGKTIAGVLESAKKQKIPIAAFCGVVELSPEQQDRIGLQYSCSILKEVSSMEDALNNSYTNPISASYNFAKLLKSN